MTLAHALLLLAGCASDPMDGEARRASAAQAIVPFLSLAWTAESNQAGAQFGSSVSSAGDVNGDGYGDVIVGAYWFDSREVAEGQAFVYLGSAAGLDPYAAWTAESDQSQSYFGLSVSSAGDVNGDGYGDVLVGAHGYNEEGRAFAYLGSAAGLDLTEAWTAEPDDFAPWFAYSVSFAGDVNGDGYGDVVVGAPEYDNGEEGEGRAYVYLGSAAGLAPTAAWTAESDQDSANFGQSVSSAGDVNGDGYADVVVGALLYEDGSTDEGRAYVYLGSAVGLDPIAAWMAESDQEGAGFGESVSSAGDVNGDGYGDVVVGASYLDNGATNEGRAYLYLGSAAGLATSAAWTAEADLYGAHFGRSVSSAGDVNGDGYGDVVIGADGYSNPTNDEGRAYVYFGSAAGLAPSAAWTAESNQSYAFFGCSVSSAGDVNGDEYGDVVIGADGYSNGSNDEGGAFQYEGSCDDPADSDADNVGDACDACAGFDDALDADVDGVPDDCDVCPTYADPGQEDDDADGIGDACDPCPGNSPDADIDGFCEAEDCDDADPSSYPGGPELCDGADNNCDGVLPPDENDDDGDASPNCADCADTDHTRFPGAEERCNDIDDDCDGAVGPNEIDADGDLYSACDGDCDESETRANSHLIEVCGDAIDNNCNGVVDEACGSEESDSGCACNDTGAGGAPSLLALAVVLRAARRRRWSP